MAAVQGQLPDGGAEGADGADGTGGEGAPLAFRSAVAGLRGVRPRPEVELDPTPPPRRLAPYSYALEAVVAVEDEELAEGRLILLHDPAGHEAWQGGFRLVTLVHADLEPEIAADPLLPEVCWSWLTGALEARGVSYGAASGTVTLASSHYFGGMADREPMTRIEIRASWTPPETLDLDRGAREAGFGGPAGLAPRPARATAEHSPRETAGVPDTGAHLAAWCELLCQVAGLPPTGAGEAGVVSLPQRRGPQPH